MILYQQAHLKWMQLSPTERRFYQKKASELPTARRRVDLANSIASKFQPNVFEMYMKLD